MTDMPQTQLLFPVLMNLLIYALPPAVIAIIALARAGRGAAPGPVRTAAVLLLAGALLTGLGQVLWAVFIGSMPEALMAYQAISLVLTLLTGLLYSVAVLMLVLALWRGRAAARRGPARGGYGGYRGHGGAEPVYHHGYYDPRHRDDDHGNRPAAGGAPEAPHAYGQPGDPGAAPAYGAPHGYGRAGGPDAAPFQGSHDAPPADGQPGDPGAAP
ncbi:hypothetical protein ACJOS4_34090, partial [Nocardiopsis sp. frass3]